jgi:prolyl oligopeptidase
LSAPAYHWLETPPSESKETEAWVDAQVSLTNEHLKLNPDRDAYREALTKNWNYAKFSVPSLKKDGNFYFSYNSGYVHLEVPKV